MQRIKHIDEKLVAWAEWRIGASGGYRSPVYHEFDVRYTNDPINGPTWFSVEQEALAMRMDRAIAALPKDLKETVIAVYTWEGGPEMVARKMRITRATVHRRLCHADIRIDDWICKMDSRKSEVKKNLKNNFATYTN